MIIDELAAVLVTVGCPAGKSIEMAQQLDKRARQLSTAKAQSYEQSITYLLNLMKQGWAAQTKR